MTRLTVLLILVSSSLAVAKDRPVSISKRAVEMVAQKKGPLLLGAILNRLPDGSVRIAVSRPWLKKAEPKLFSELQQQQEKETAVRNRLLIKRLDVWMKERVADERLIFALKAEKQRLEKQLATKKDEAKRPQAKKTEFFVITVDGKNVRSVRRKSIAERLIAAHAWNQNLPDVEDRSTDDLRSELKKLEISKDSPKPDLASRLPAVDESEEDFAVRKAFFEYQFRKRLDYQGTGGLLLKAGDATAVDPGEMLNQLMQSQLGSKLSDLLGSRPSGSQSKQSEAGLRQAQKSAESEGLNAFRTTTMKHDLARMSVTVTTRFYAKISSDKWKLVVSLEVPFDASKVNPAAEQSIKDDPRVKSIFDTLKGVGLDDAVMQKALKFGAATQQAQSQADAKFAELLDRYIRRVDGPPLPKLPITSMGN